MHEPSGGGIPYYILQGHEPVRVDLMTWAKWFEVADRQVAYDKFNGLEISTVFLGMDQNWGFSARPVIFETMVFGCEVEVQVRYSTWDKAIEGHRIIVEKIKGDLAAITAVGTC